MLTSQENGFFLNGGLYSLDEGLLMGDSLSLFDFTSAFSPIWEDVVILLQTSLLWAV
jgi:hypothetical protein